MAELSSRLKKAFNQYDTKDAVLDYVDSLSNPCDLLSGDLKILKDIKEDNFSFWYNYISEPSQRLENNNYDNAAAKRDDCDKAMLANAGFYDVLKYKVKEYSPETYKGIDDSFFELRQSKYILSEKDAILAYYQSLNDPQNLLSGVIGREYHWKDNKTIYDSFIEYKKQLAHYEYCGEFKSMEQRAEESKELANVKIAFYDSIHGQLNKFFPEYAVLYDEHINPSMFDVSKESLGMKEYVESLRDKTDIRTGNPYYLPEFLKPYWERIEDLSKEGAKLDYDSKSVQSVYEKILNDAVEHYKAITSNVVQEPELSYSKSNSESIKDYVESLKNPADFLSGQMELLPSKLNEKYGVLWDMEETWHQEARLYHPDEREPYKQELLKTRKEFYTELKEACETYLNNKENIHQQNSDMKEKKIKDSENKEETKVKNSESKEEKKEPQLVTVNGDKITHAHAFKSNKSEDWFYTARINGMPLKPQVMDKNDVERIFTEKGASVKDMMQKYYPTVLMQKVAAAEFKLPKTITTANGDEQILKFNVYKENRPENENYGKYRLYAQVGEKKMSCNASKQDLDAYFNRVVTPTQLIIKNFGDKLGLAAHYEQFKLPEGMNFEGKNILLKKNQETNKYEISVKMADGSQTPAKELNYDDRQSYFQHKVATKEQLAAKYLYNELTTLSISQKPKLEKQVGMSM
ncbi:MAG: hypothetical protein K2N34_08825 [Lachnospiraceae bacterium]|nr:hypothetical protein [Lachnospiraceae bacterium]